METIAKLTIVSSLLSLACLFTLHFVSPEFDPSWRMISEYARGNYKWLLTLFFFLGSMSTFLATALLWKNVTVWWAMIGVVLIFVSGVGGLMGGLFDVKHKLHGLAFALGVPTLPLGAILVSYHLVKNDIWRSYKLSILFSAHAIWISIALVAITMMLLISGFKAAGIPVGPDAEPANDLPIGVVALNGYANRLLVICCSAWVLIVAGVYLSRK